MMTRIHDKIPDLKRIGPDLLDEWLEQSRAGDVISRNKMLIWVHRSELEIRYLLRFTNALYYL